MKKTLTQLAVVLSLFTIGCSESNTEHDHAGGKSANEAAVPKMSASDLLFDEIMGFHDEAMPKMGKLRGYQNLAQTKIDSLAKHSDAASKALKAEFETLLAGLKRADKGMMDWMDTFEPKEDSVGEETIKPYYEAEKVKAKAMRDDIFSMLDSAAAKLGS